MEPSPLVDTKAIADVADVSVRTVERWAKTGVLPSVRVGGALRFDPEAVAETLARPASL